MRIASVDRFRDRVMFDPQYKGAGHRIWWTHLGSKVSQIFELAGNTAVPKGLVLYGLFERVRRFVMRAMCWSQKVTWMWLRLLNWDSRKRWRPLGTACTPTHVQKLLRQTDQSDF